MKHLISEIKMILNALIVSGMLRLKIIMLLKKDFGNKEGRKIT